VEDFGAGVSVKVDYVSSVISVACVAAPRAGDRCCVNRLALKGDESRNIESFIDVARDQATRQLEALI
jgi:hypothetical protein